MKDIFVTVLALGLTAPLTLAGERKPQPGPPGEEPAISEPAMLIPEFDEASAAAGQEFAFRIQATSYAKGATVTYTIQGSDGYKATRIQPIQDDGTVLIIVRGAAAGTVYTIDAVITGTGVKCRTRLNFDDPEPAIEPEEN